MALAADAIEFTDFAAAIPLHGTTQSGGKRVVGLRIIAATSGASVVVKTEGGSTNRTLTVAAGEEIPVRIRSIESVTNVTRIRVYLE